MEIERRFILCPPRPGTAGAREPRQLLRSLHRLLNERAPTLLLCQQPRDLALSCEPGLKALYVPCFPELEQRALAASDAVLSFAWEAAAVAKTHGIPYLLVCFDEREARAAQSEGLTVWRAPRGVRAADVLKRFFLELPPSRPSDSAVAREARSVARQKGFHLALIADHQYLVFLLSLLENLKLHGPLPERIHILALDDKTYWYLEEAGACEWITLYQPTDLWSCEEWVRLGTRRTADQAYSSKARLLEKALQIAPVPECVFYVDLDLFFLRSVCSLRDGFDSGTVLLFPQWNDRLWTNRFYGLFNAGIVGVRPGAQSFLQWWAELCLHEYCTDFRQGYFVDQGLLDLAPLYFPDLCIDRRGKHNAAAWNLKCLAGGEIHSFHAAHPDETGWFEKKCGWDQCTAFFSDLAEESLQVVQANTLHQQSQHWTDLSRLLYLAGKLRWKAFRIPQKPGRAPLGLERFFLSGAGRRILAALARIHYPWRRLWRPDPLPPSSRYWLAFQQSYLKKRSEAVAPPPVEPAGTALLDPSRRSPPSGSAHPSLFH